jgi:hypothetical protein
MPKLRTTIALGNADAVIAEERRAIVASMILLCWVSLVLFFRFLGCVRSNVDTPMIEVGRVRILICGHVSNLSSSPTYAFRYWNLSEKCVL